MLYFWVKSFHIVFVISWYAGLFYLPRIFVNLAAVPADSTAERERLLGMAQRLFRFMTGLAMFAIGGGLWLWWGWNMVGGWLIVKIVLVLALVGYHLSCSVLLDGFVRGRNRRSERWFRIYNEVPVVVLLAIVILVVNKPF